MPDRIRQLIRCYWGVRQHAETFGLDDITSIVYDNTRNALAAEFAFAESVVITAPASSASAD